jgi:hypothetical protein
MSVEDRPLNRDAARELERLALREANTASALAARAAAGRAALTNGKGKHP